MRILGVLVLLWVSACLRAQDAYFVIEAMPQGRTFVIRTSDPAIAEHARAIIDGRRNSSVHLMGAVVKAPAFYNPGWSFHLDPGSLQFFDTAIEVCDGAIDELERNLEDVGGAYLPRNHWCPWGSRPIREIPEPEGAGRALTAVSAASYRAVSLSPDSIAAVFGRNMTTVTESATTLPLPTVLGGVSIEIRGRNGEGPPIPAGLFYVSPSQVNFLVPPEAPHGTVTLNLIAPDGRTFTCHTRVEPASPALFGAGGFAAANIVRMRPDGSAAYEPVVTRDPASGAIVPVPIRFDPGSRLFLALYGTGLRVVPASSIVVGIGSFGGPPIFAGAHPTAAGLDQVNVELPASLAGAGEVRATVIAEWNGRLLESNELRLVFGN